MNDKKREDLNVNISIQSLKMKQGILKIRVKYKDKHRGNNR